MIQSFPHERRATASLGLLYVFRMLGLFMVLPVLLDYGQTYQHSSPQLLGLALGIYGFSQAVLQIPFGLWSDRWGRKPVIAVGLLLFALGSVVAAVSDSVYGLILGRFLQGGGAIAAAIMAMVADLTSDKNRTKSMAAIGASIGLSFILALILGPQLAAIGGLPAIFWATAILAGIGILVLWILVPKVETFSSTHGLADSPSYSSVHSPILKKGSDRTSFAKVLRNKELLRLNYGICCLHFVLIASFTVIPRFLGALPQLSRDQHSWVYGGVLLGSFVAMLPMMILIERKKWIKMGFVGAVVLLGMGQGLLMFGHQSLVGLLVALFVFFMAFNFLEANLPSLVSKVAPAQSRGTATGLYSSSQFLGMFLGGAGGGFVLEHWGPEEILVLCIVAIASWLLVASFMTGPQPLADVVVPVRREQWDQMLPQLSALPGVAEVSYREDQNAAFLRVDERLFQHESLLGLEGS